MKFTVFFASLAVGLRAAEAQLRAGGIKECSSDAPCARCEGDCDSDSDCMEGLVCHSNIDMVVPGTYMYSSQDNSPRLVSSVCSKIQFIGCSIPFLC